MKQPAALALLLAAAAACTGGDTGAVPQPAPPPAPGAAATAAPEIAPPVRAAWSPAQVREILNKTQTTRLAPDLAHLSEGERTAVAKLIEVGGIFQALYEDQRHSSAWAARRALASPSSPEERDLAALYRLFQGPIATTLDNRREPFLDVGMPGPGKNVYPEGLTAEAFEAYLAAHPEQRSELTDLRSVVRRQDRASLARDIEALRRHPVVDALHPGYRRRLETLVVRPDPSRLYAAPYAIAYADEMVRAHGLLSEAAAAVQGDDPQFARYLRARARDLLTNDYEAGDASWITGRFRNLNAQIGAYETYDDELYGTRAFYSLSILGTRREETEALRRGLQGLQAVEDALPYDRRKRIREDIPVGVYDVIADFGQSRGGNTASILPNETSITERYGRTILLRTNIMRAPEIFGAAGNAWRAAVAPQFAAHLTADSNFQRTLWHEVGHYLGVDRTRDGRTLDDALGADSNLFEEMKADLVSLFARRAFASAAIIRMGRSARSTPAASTARSRTTSRAATSPIRRCSSCSSTGSSIAAFCASIRGARESRSTMPAIRRRSRRCFARCLRSRTPATARAATPSSPAGRGGKTRSTAESPPTCAPSSATASASSPTRRSANEARAAGRDCAGPRAELVRRDRTGEDFHAPQAASAFARPSRRRLRSSDPARGPDRR
jgi:hypothetical protein